MHCGKYLPRFRPIMYLNHIWRRQLSASVEISIPRRIPVLSPHISYSQADIPSKFPSSEKPPHANKDNNNMTGKHTRGRFSRWTREGPLPARRPQGVHYCLPGPLSLLCLTVLVKRKREREGEGRAAQRIAVLFTARSVSTEQWNLTNRAGWSSIHLLSSSDYGIID